MGNRPGNIGGIIALIWISVIMASCTQSRNVQTLNRGISDIYNPSRSSLHPQYSIHNINDSSTLVYIRISTGELLFDEANKTQESMASLSLSYTLFHFQEDNKKLSLEDSASINKTLYRESARNGYYLALPVKAYSGSRYIIKISVRDNLRGSENLKYIVINKTTPYNSHNFKVISPKTQYPLFKNIFTSRESFMLQFNQLGYDSVYVDYFSLDRTLPRPVFSDAPDIQMRSDPDSSWALPYNDTISYHLSNPGIYLFKMEKNEQTGCALYNFGENFPRTQTSTDLLGPLAYLSSTAEFRDLRHEPNRKLAIDNFWLDIASDMDDARELIRVYYNRVLFSNFYFSSYKEGWKTDRGMIYIIFGPPDMLEKLPDLEIWKYRTKKTNSPLEFRFERKDNLFSDEDYQLDRSSSSTSIWLDAVQSWKRGKIYASEL